MPPGGAPKNWVGCPALSTELVSNTFLSFKTPLSDQINSRLPWDERFYTKHIIDYAVQSNFNLQLWIDLTNTSRYYSPEEVNRAGIRHVKLSLEGHGKAPQPSQVNSFIKIVEKNGERGSIGVHCTHGFNRTGYLICAYLILRKNISVAEAVMEFRDKRPPGIYRLEYIEDLFRVHKAKNPGILCFVPNWAKNEFKESNENEKFRIELFPYPEIDVEFEFGTWKVLDRLNFLVGQYPFNPQTINLTKTIPKFPSTTQVTWFSRGAKFTLFILQYRQIYLISEERTVWLVGNLLFPDFDGQHLMSTVLVGELTRIQAPQITPAFIISDILCVRGDPSVQWNLSLDQRRALIRSTIIAPRQSVINSGILNQSQESLAIRTKPYFTLNNLKSLLNPEFNFRLEHPPLGINFVSQQPQTHSFIWPWPMAHLKVENGKVLTRDGYIVQFSSGDLESVQNGDVVQCNWTNEKVWEVGKRVCSNDWEVDCFNDVQRIQDSLSRIEVLSLFL